MCSFGIRLENTNPPHFFCDRNASRERRVRPISALLQDALCNSSMAITPNDLSPKHHISVHLAEAFNLPVTSHGAHDVTVHLLAACPNRSYLEAHGFGLERYIAEPLRIDDGCAIAPRRPGHGVKFDWKSLDRMKA
jgi:Enolase C-terminal domain-like